MLQNNLDPEVAEHPEDLVVYGGTGKAARDWASFDAIVRTLQTLKDDETLLVQSGKPVGVLQTHEWAPRVLLANSNLVGDWANWDEFRRLEALGLTMYGQMTAGSWIYIGTQGILQGTYETFAAVGEQALRRLAGGHDHADRRARRDGRRAAAGGDDGRRRRDLRRGRPVADRAPDRARLPRRRGRRPRRRAASWPSRRATRAARSRSACSATAPTSCRSCWRRGAPIDIVTDQTSAHDPLAYLPRGRRVRGLGATRAREPGGFTDRARESMARHVEAMVGFQDAGAEVFDYGNSIRAEAQLGGYERAFDFPGFVPAYIRPLFCEGRGPFRWAALSGDPADIAATDRAVLDLFPENESLARWMQMAAEKVHFQGLPARICWLGYGERHLAGLRFNELVASGEVDGADRDRPRPPRLRLGRLALPRDRGDARRLGRDRRLAAAQRDGQRAPPAPPGCRSTTAAASASAARSTPAR